MYFHSFEAQTFTMDEKYWKQFEQAQAFIGEVLIDLCYPDPRLKCQTTFFI